MRRIGKSRAVRWRTPKITKRSIIADYDAQSAVERELVLRLASLLWRLRRATTMETSLFEIQADHLGLRCAGDEFSEENCTLVPRAKRVAHCC